MRKKEKVETDSDWSLEQGNILESRKIEIRRCPVAALVSVKSGLLSNMEGLPKTKRYITFFLFLSPASYVPTEPYPLIPYSTKSNLVGRPL
jgi:hypothetical protein